MDGKIVSATPVEIDIKNLVVKSNDLIEATYRLTLQEQRILLVLASKVQPQDEELKIYKFKVQDFVDIIGAKRGTGIYSYIKDIVTGLQTKTLILRRGSKTIVSNWLITSVYEDNEGTIILKFNPDLKYLFLDLKKYTSYQLGNVLQLNSTYAIRIYELLRQYLAVGERTLTVEDLRQKLSIEPNKYKQYGHFKSRIINSAQEEINEKTDILFSFEEYKTGRKVTSIKFIIKQKKSLNLVKGNENTEVVNNSELIEQLKKYDIIGDKAIYIINNFDNEHIRRNLLYVDKQMKSTDIENIGGYAFNTIKNDYAASVRHKKRRVTSRFVSLENTEKESSSSIISSFEEARGFEEKCLRLRELKIRMSKLSGDPGDKGEELAKKELISLIKEDIHQHLDNEKQPRNPEEFKNPLIKEIYEQVYLEYKTN